MKEELVITILLILGIGYFAILSVRNVQQYMLPLGTANQIETYE